DGQVVAVNADTGAITPVGRFPGLDSYDYLVAGPGGRPLVASAYGRGVSIWNVDGGKETHLIPGAGVYDVTPDGKAVVGCEPGGAALQVWDAATGKPRFPESAARGHTGNVNALAISRDGRLLVSASSDDGSVRAWNLAGGP